MKDLEYENTLKNISTALSRSNAIIEFDLDGNILSANDNFLDLVGYSSDELIGKHHSILLREDQVNTPDYNEFWKQLKRGKFHKGEFERRKKSGKKIWIIGSYNPIFNSDGKLMKILKIAMDVTKRKIAEEKIIANKRLF